MSVLTGYLDPDGRWIYVGFGNLDGGVRPERVVDFGDGTPALDAALEEFTLTHQYAVDGTYTIVATEGGVPVETLTVTVPTGLDGSRMVPFLDVGLPTVAEVEAYLGDGTSWDTAEITSAYAAERAAQADVCRIPAPYPHALREALFRRVAHNLALRALPLGVQASISDMAVATTRVGGLDAEVARLEAPYRKMIVG